MRGLEGARPVSQAERIVAIDIVRGFALLGVLLMNNQYQFRYPSELRALVHDAFPGAVDHAADFILHLFVEAKAMTLFTFLFGMGLGIQLERVEGRGGSFGVYAVRRLGSLFAIGLLHVALFWWGDVTHIYAALGFVYLLFIRRRQRTLLLWGIGLVVVPGVVAVVLRTVLATPPAVPSFPAAMAGFGSEAILVYRGGSWLEVAAFRWHHLVSHWNLFTFAVFLPYCLGMFLVGLWTWRSGAVQSPEAHRAFLRRVAAIGIGVGLLLTGTDALTRLLELKSVALRTTLAALEFSTATPLLAVGYGAGILLLTLHPGARRLLAPMAPVGRMALTNYLCQSLFMTWIMNGYGLGYYAKLGPAAGAAVALGVFAFQVVTSRIWLRHFRFGPAEWLWRTMTYGQRQPLAISRTT